MIFFFIFILMLTIYEIYHITKDNKLSKEDKIRLYIVYTIILIFALGAGIYYYLNINGILHYILKVLNVKT